MFKRTLFVLVGVGAGVTLGVWAVRKVESTSRKLRPDAMAATAGRGISSVGGRLREAIEQGRAAAADKESELRAVYRGGTWGAGQSPVPRAANPG